MGYSDYLIQLLKPLGVYDLENNGYNVAELTVLGMALDECCGVCETLERECFISTAEDYGLSMYEAIMPKHYAYLVNTRRAALIAMLSVNNSCFTEKALNEALSGCGEPTAVSETGEAMQVIVDFTDIDMKPVNFELLSNWVESMLPCHLDVIYAFEQT